MTTAADQLIPEIIAGGIRICLRQSIYNAQERMHRDFDKHAIPLDHWARKMADAYCSDVLDLIKDEGFWGKFDTDEKG